MLGNACPANSNGAHVPSRRSCQAGYAGPAAAVATVLPTAAHSQRCLPCELKTEVVRRAGAHGRQAMHALRRLALRSSLQRLMFSDACPPNPNEDHVPSRCSCDLGYALIARCSCNAGYEALRQLSLISRAQVEIVCLVGARAGRLGRHCVGFHYGSFNSNSSSRCLPCELKQRSCAE